MTLYETIDLLKKIALKHPNIGSASEGNIYEYMNANPSVKYGVFFITQGTHSQDEMFNHFEFTLFYVDRLVDNMEENRLQIQSIGKEILSNILTFFCEEFDAECENISFQPFTQKFVDETCGIYSTITIDVPKDVICPEEYWNEDWKTPVVVIRNQDKRVVFTENGTYTIDYDPNTYTGLGTVEVEVNIDVDSYYNNGYNQGKIDGISEQKSKLERIEITENGTYAKEDGYNEIIVDVPDLNGSYNEGYEQGKADGINEQKSKLETINITENGVYSNEDGYNHIEVNVPDLNGSYEEGYNQGYAEGEQVSYGKGYEDGQTDIAANARVLEVTENGNYLSKFSDPVIPTTVTGVYANGTDFYSYAELGNKVYNTNITVTQDSVVELWYKGDNVKTDDGWNTIFGCAKTDDEDFYLGYMYSDNTNLRGWLGQKQVQFSWDDNVWHHIIMKNDGLWIDDTLIGSFNTTKTFAYNLGLNGTWDELIRNANGCYGMIKIDDVVIIPTADGFLNTNTGELLEVVKNGAYTFTENLPIYPEGELFKTINVNVLPKVNIQKAGLKFGQSTFTEVPEWVDFEGITNMEYMFNYCTNLKTIPQLDTSNVSNMSNMFKGCHNLQTIPLLDTSNVTNMNYMFYDCDSLQTIPLIDTSNVINMEYMFGDCNKLKTIPPIDTSNVTDMNHMFYTFSGIKTLISLPKFNCQKVTNMNQYFSYYANGMSALTDVGGWENLKCKWDDRYGLASCPNLTYQSCINILNGLYNFTGNGETPNSSQGRLKVHANFLTTVGEEISIGTSRGWTITA